MAQRLELTKDELLRALIPAGKTQRDVARRLGVSDSYLSEILKGRRDVSDAFLAAVGYERVVRFVKVRKARTG